MHLCSVYVSDSFLRYNLLSSCSFMTNPCVCVHSWQIHVFVYIHDKPMCLSCIMLDSVLEVKNNAIFEYVYAHNSCLCFAGKWQFLCLECTNRKWRCCDYGINQSDWAKYTIQITMHVEYCTLHTSVLGPQSANEIFFVHDWEVRVNDLMWWSTK